MAHMAQLDENNKVLQVIVVANEELMENDVESENKGIAFCKTLLGANTNWVQTSYNANFRKNYAGIGYSYDATRDAFIAPKPFESWVLDEATCQWQAPTPYPTDDKLYTWDEPSLTWLAHP
jgi:hypothetical protein